MHIIKGKVREGNRRGKELGYPTANINLHKNVPQGIYISKLKLNNSLYNSITFIGNAKTFNERTVLAETYILDFNKDIYNKWVTVKLIKKIRNNQKFDTVDALVIQIKKDIKKARLYFKNV